MRLVGASSFSAVLVLVTSAAGCGSDDRSGASPDDKIPGGDDDDNDDVGNDDGGSSKLDIGEQTGSEDPDADDDGDCKCQTNSDLIYVLSDMAELWSYAPQTNEFKSVGDFDCGVTPDTFSMGVARDGIAWIMFNTTGEIYNVNVNSANECEPSGYNAAANLDFKLFGMAFVSNSENDPCDKLYTHTFDGTQWSEGPGTGKLGVMQPVDLEVDTIADIAYNGGELTGTGHGRLFAFAGTPQAKLIEYDKDDGSVIETIGLQDLELTLAFAFGFWGGDFYFFTEGDGVFPTYSKVTKLDHDESDGNGQALTTVNDQAPIRIVGAGVSTCAPTEDPVE